MTESQLNPATFISTTTVRLECLSASGAVSVGTGFFYAAEVELGGGELSVIPLLVTNKHVVDGYAQALLDLTYRPDGAELSECVVSDTDVHVRVLITELQNRIVRHPSDDVDLCAIFAQDLTDLRSGDGLQLRNGFLNRHSLIAAGDRRYIRPIEPILMVGYPNGLWDEVNNRPLARRGSTASHPYLRWSGRREFVIDAACFPGSSGSPVFLFEDVMYRTSENAYTPGTRAQLLGVLASGPVITSEGRLIQRSIPTATSYVPVMSNTMNLGNVVHADAVLDLVPLAAEVARGEATFVRAVAV